jgi:hypothetical protein
MDAVCWVCLGDEEEGHPLLRGCACRGSAGWQHINCLVEVATRKRAQWTRCPTCKQHWVGEVQLGLAHARFKRTRARPIADFERLTATAEFATALCDCCGDLSAAQPLYEEVLAVKRRTTGPRDPCTLVSINVGTVNRPAHAHTRTY